MRQSGGFICHEKPEKVRQSAKIVRISLLRFFFSFLMGYSGGQESGCPQRKHSKFAADFWTAQKIHQKKFTNYSRTQRVHLKNLRLVLWRTTLM